MAKSIKYNYLLNCLLTASSVLFPVLTFPYVSRILLPEGMGKVSLALSVIAYFDLIAQMGIPTYGVRACARVRHDRKELSRTAHELFTINMITTFLSYVALAVAFVVVPKFQSERTLYLIVSSTLFLSAVGMEWIFKAMEKYTYITLRSLAFKVIALISMFLLIHERDDYVIYGAISIFATSASNLSNLFAVRKLISLKPVGGYSLKRHLRPVVIFFAMACATTIYTNMDSVMLGIICTEYEVGLYSSAVKIKAVLVSVVTSLGVVMLPRVSSYFERGMFKDFWRMGQKALRFVILLSMPLCIYFMIFSRTSIYLLSGGAFEGSIFPMRIIMPTLVLIGVTNVTGIQMLVPMMKEKAVLISAIIGAVVNLFANATLIPLFGVEGAAFATVLAELSVLFVQVYYLKKYKPDFFQGLNFERLIVALLVACLASGWTLFMSFTNIFTLILSSALFFGSYLIVLLLTKEPLVNELLKELFLKLRSKE